MARLNQGILGGISGAIGNVVGSSWKGIAVIKSKPLSVANPQSAGQVAQRTKMSNTVAFAQVILAGVIKPLWDRFAQKQSGYNAFVSSNIALFTNQFANPAADLVISKGKMEATEITAVNATNGSPIVNLTFPTTSGTGFLLSSDVAYAVVVNETKEEVGYIAADANREDGFTDVVMPSSVATGNVLQCYLAFRRNDGTIVSDTGYKTDTV